MRVESERKSTGHYPLDNLYVDNVAAAQCAVDYLLQQGYQRIAMISGQEGPGKTRQEGYRQALEARGQKSEEYLIHMDGFTEQDGYRGMQALLLQPLVPDAVFASNDLLAIGAMLAAREAGLRVPEDIALVGFDDIPTARLVTPPLTTVSQLQREMGRRAAEMLFERLGDHPTGPGRCEELPFQFIVRESA